VRPVGGLGVIGVQKEGMGEDAGLLKEKIKLVMTEGGGMDSRLSPSLFLLADEIFARKYSILNFRRLIESK
jgi:hypothetical protein